MNKLTEKRNTLYAQAQALVKKAEDEGRAFTEEEKTSYQNTVAEVRSLDEQLKADQEIRNLALNKSQPTGTDDDDKAKAERETRVFEAFLRGGKETVKELSPLFAMATKYGVRGDITIPKIDRSSGDITVAFSAEFSTLTANGFKFGSITLSGHLAAALVLISKQLINNSQIDVVSIVIQKLAEKIASFVENFLLNGDANIPNSGLKGSIDTTNNVKSVASVAALTADDLVDVQDIIPDAYQSGACWIMSPSMRNKVRKLKDGQGNYLLIADYTKGSGYTLLGKPVYVTENLPAAASASSGNIIAYYGDFSGLAVKTGEQAEIQLLVEKYAEQHALGINTWFEMDARVENTQKIAALALS